MEELKYNLDEALSLHQNNQTAEAEKIYKNIINSDSDNLDAVYYYGLLLYQTSRFDEALENFKKILDCRPDGEILITLLNLTGEIYLHKGNLELAEKYFKAVLVENPCEYSACFNLGHIYDSLNNKAPAESYYLKASESEQAGREVYDKLLKIYSDKNDTDNIIKCLNKLIGFDPSDYKLYFEAGVNYLKKYDAKNAHAAYAKAISLKPDFAPAHINLGILFHRVYDFDNAKKHLNKGLELNEDFFEAYNALGNVYVDTGEVHKVREISLRGLKKSPGNSYLLFNIARADFLDGNLDKGWEYFKHRRLVSEKKGLKTYLLDYKGSLKDKKVLVYWDSGFGDSLQFLRYLTPLKEAGAEVLLKIQEPLRTLVESSGFDVEILPEKAKIQDVEHDLQVNLTSLSYLYKPDNGNIHFSDTYLKPDEEKVRAWKEKYFNNSDLKIGLVWLSHVNSYKKNIDNVSEFYNISKIPGVKLYSLQQTCGKPLLEGLPEDFNIVNLGDEFKDFSDTAAVVENIDLLVAIDTAVVHLAGAMGKPVYCLLPDVPNWRWFMHGEDCPWYDSVKLFRQKEPGNWKPVLEEVQKEIESELCGV